MQIACGTSIKTNSVADDCYRVLPAFCPIDIANLACRVLSALDPIAIDYLLGLNYRYRI